MHIIDILYYMFVCIHVCIGQWMIDVEYHIMLLSLNTFYWDTVHTVTRHLLQVSFRELSSHVLILCVFFVEPQHLLSLYHNHLIVVLSPDRILLQKVIHFISTLFTHMHACTHPQSRTKQSLRQPLHSYCHPVNQH